MISHKLPFREVMKGLEIASIPEQELLAVCVDAEGEKDGSVATFVASLQELQPAISRFFDEVLVMDEDESVRHNRLALLQRIAALADGIADLSYLEGF